jgi:hypothetical protein
MNSVEKGSFTHFYMAYMLEDMRFGTWNVGNVCIGSKAVKICG